MLAIVEIFFEIIFEIFGEVIICGFFSLLGEFISTIAEKTGDAIEATTDAIGSAAEATSDALSSATETAESASIGCLVVFILLVTGIVAGIVISGVFPDRIFSTIPITGVSLLITPLVMGLLMSLVGKWKGGLYDCLRRRQREATKAEEAGLEERAARGTVAKFRPLA